jgi:hypothetical protein
MRTLITSVLFACLLTYSGSCRLPRSTPPADITIAFSYYDLSEEDIDFLSHFDVIVTHKFADRNTLKQLKASDAKILYYEWLPGMYYCGDNENWGKMVYQNRVFWTLDPLDSGPNPMGEKLGCIDLFYDMANEDMMNARVDHLVHAVQSHRYDGIFFDWGSGWNAFIEYKYDFLTGEFIQRHPDLDYNDTIKEFMKKLKEHGLLIMLNGGFRSDQAELNGYADYDIVESMFTTTDCNNNYYEIYIESEGTQKVCDTWFNDVDRAVSLAMQLPARARAANVDIPLLFLNYAFPFYQDTGEVVETDKKTYKVRKKTVDRQALYYALACSYIGNSPGFTNGDDVSLNHVKDHIYFESLGQPETDITKLRDGVYARFFSEGLVIVSNKDISLVLTLPDGRERIYDLYEQRYVGNGGPKVQVTLTSQVYASGLKHPIGRIYRYEH